MSQLNSEATKYKSNSKANKASDKVNNTRYARDNENNDKINESIILLLQK